MKQQITREINSLLLPTDSPPGADARDHHDLYEMNLCSNSVDKLHTLISHELMALEPSKGVVNPNRASFFFISIPLLFFFLHPTQAQAV